MLPKASTVSELLARASLRLQVQPFSDSNLEHQFLMSLTPSLSAWALVVLCVTLSTAAMFTISVVLHVTEFHAFLYAMRFILLVGAKGLTIPSIVKRYPVLVMSGGSFLLATFSVFMVMENPEVLPSYLPVVGEPRVAMELLWTQDPDVRRMLWSKPSSELRFPASCLKSEILNMTYSTWLSDEMFDARCNESKYFAYNFMLMQCFLVGTAAFSGLPLRFCMATWLMSQFACGAVLIMHKAPSFAADNFSAMTIIFLSFCACYWASLNAEQQSRMSMLFRANSTLISMNHGAVAERQKWMQGVHRSSQLAGCVRAALRREEQLHNILAVSVDAIVEISVTDAHKIELLLTEGSHQKVRLETLIGKCAPMFFEELLPDSEQDRWTSYVARSLTGRHDGKGLEIIKVNLGTRCVEGALCLAQSAECQSFLALREVASDESDYSRGVDLSSTESAWEPCGVSCDGLDCISKTSLVMLEDGTLEPVGNLVEGRKILAMDAGSGQLISTQVKQLIESVANRGDLVEIKCSSGIQTTCTPEHLVLSRDGGMGFQEKKAAELVIGDLAQILQVREETIVATRKIQSPSAEVVSIEIDHENAFVFSADVNSTAALAIRPNMLQHGSITSGFRAKQIDMQPSESDLSSSITSTSHGTTFKIGRGAARILALSEVAQIPRGPGGPYSVGSRRHPFNCAPCWFLDRPKGCADGVLCNHCHHPHKELTASGKRKKSHKMKTEAQALNICMPTVTQTIKNTFIEWTLPPDSQYEGGVTFGIPSLRRTRSLP